MRSIKPPWPGMVSPKSWWDESGVVVEWEWCGGGMGVEWEWCGGGMGVERWL